MTEKMAALAKQIATLPRASVDFSVLPSGSAMLDVRRDGRLYVLAYSPERGFGVDEVGDDDGFLVSYRFTYPGFEPAAARLWELVVGTPASTEEADGWQQFKGRSNDHSEAVKVKQNIDADTNPP
jgi:hypothetical protein